MKVLILSVSAGYGHHSAANALEECLRERGVEVQTVDVLEKINRLLQEIVSRGYVLSTKYAKDAYRVVYTMLENKNQSTSKYAMPNAMSALLSMRFAAFLKDAAPDAVICTHVTAAQIINEIKRRGKLSAPTVGIVTDYTIHPFWEDATEVEYVVVASDPLVQRAELRGIMTGHIKPFGIPIHPKYSKKQDKTEVRRRLGLDPLRPVVLVMGGSFGYGNIASLAERLGSLRERIQILAVCGRNRQQYHKLMAEGPVEGLHVYGFINNVDELMDAADCIVTKPGGLTVSEALAKRLPIILMKPIPGQEERNAEFLLNCGMAMQISRHFPIEDALHYMFANPRRRVLMEECIALYAKPNATQDITEFVISLGEGEKEAGAAL